MDSIGFNDIPADVRVPSVLTEVDSSKAIGGAQIKPWKVLMVGQRLSTGTVAQFVPKALQSVDQARLWFGAGSMLHGMAIAFFANPHVFDVTAIALDDAGGSVAATLDSTVTASSVLAGTVFLYVAGYRITAAVAAGDTAATIAASIVAAVNATDGCPVVASVVSTTHVLFTARNKGLSGTQIDVRVNYNDGENLPQGVALSNVPGVLSGGTTDPTTGTSLWTAVGEVQFDLMIIPYAANANVVAIDAELARRWGPTVQLEGSAVMAANTDLATALALGALYNSKFISIMATRGALDPPWEIAAAYGANRSFYSRNDPARPLRSLPLFGISPPIVPDRYGFAQRDQLYRSGMTPNVVIGNQVVIDRTITTYQKSGSGAADASYLDTTTVDTLSYLRWSFRERMLLRYPRHKVVKDGIRPGSAQPIVSPAIVKAEILCLFDDWKEIGLVEDPDQFKRDLIVVVNASDPTRIDCLLPINVANPLYIIAAQIQFRL
jgi:phage tail sheath gpL-like